MKGEKVDVVKVKRKNEKLTNRFGHICFVEEIIGVVSTMYDQICRKDCPAADTPEVTPFVEVRILNFAHDPKIFNGLGRARRDTKCPPFWLTDP